MYIYIYITKTAKSGSHHIPWAIITPLTTVDILAKNKAEELISLDKLNVRLQTSNVLLFLMFFSLCLRASIDYWAEFSPFVKVQDGSEDEKMSPECTKKSPQTSEIQKYGRARLE